MAGIGGCRMFTIQKKHSSSTDDSMNIVVDEKASGTNACERGYVGCH